MIRCMKITLIQVGKTVQSFLIEGIDEYQNRLKHYCNFELVTLISVKAAQSSGNIEVIKKSDSNLILSKLNTSDFVVLLDENGKEYSSIKFAEFIKSHQLISTKNLVFVIGGAYGFSEELYQRSNAKISLSRLTFSHQMVRLFFTEQLYRAFTIIKGESYHHV
jgi:23S rRNA (pseudouridine1915-N3)-methyltransferase